MGKSRIKDNPLHRLTEQGLETAGMFYSKYRGFVMDNDDPLNMNRLKVLVPVMNPTTGDGIWAFSAGQWGGNGHGIQMLPQKGDMVWIEYEMGNVEHPIWSMASYGDEELPKEFKTPNHYGFKTPNGSIVLINDNKDAEEILVKLNTNKEWINIKKDTLELESKLIKLGTNGDESGTLGDTLKEKLDELTGKVEELTQLIAEHTHAGPAGPPIKAAQFIIIKNQVGQIKAKFSQFLSKKVKIDK